MIGRTTALAVLGALLGSPAWAQDQRVEISGNVGWVLSDGVSGDARLAGDGNLYSRVDPTDSFSWGLTLGYFISENSEVEFLYERQESTLEIGGTNVVELGDFAIKNYHGIFAYNFGDVDAVARPFLFLGLGATSYPGIEFTRINGQQDEIGGNTQFSTTFGLGLKVYPGRNAGLRLQARWTPTYIKSDSEGYWCDPYWGCYVVGDAQYSNQFSFTGGLTFRF